ncbi:MAG: hypothetical protein M3299_16065, partial [Thermoproteota archaeon]|nr:hypothetical protein [Thermoproteota archaeon]
MITLILVFLHIKIPRIPNQAAQVIGKTSPNTARLGENPAYATDRPTIMVVAPANTPIPPI